MALSRQEILERLALIEEKKKRLFLSKPPYLPTEGQRRVLESSASEIFNFSGNGSGKTALNVQLAMMYARGYNPWTKEHYKVPAKVAFICDTSRKIDERIIPEFKKWFEIDEKDLKKEGRPYTSKLLLPNGSEISFMTADADPMSMEGVEFSVVVIDEPFPRLLYIALKRSLRMKGHANKLIFSGTAISEAWLRRDIFDPWQRGELPTVACFNMKTEDNRANLATTYIEDFSRSLTESEKKVRLEGGFFDRDSLAFSEHFDYDTHVVKNKDFTYDYRMPCVVAVDPHMAKPTTAIMLTVDRNNNYLVVKEGTHKGNATQFAAFLNDWEKGYNVVDRVCDSLGATEKTSGEGMHSFIEGLNQNGIFIRSTTFKEKNAEDLVDRLRQGFAIPAEADAYGRKTPKLRIHEDCQKLIKDIQQVTWQKNRMTGELIPKLDTSTRDYLSCLGYSLATSIFYDIIHHKTPSYKEEPVLKAHRQKIIDERNSRVRQRFFRRMARNR